MKLPVVLSFVAAFVGMTSASAEPCEWSQLGSGMHGAANVLALTVYDDGSGDALYAGGSFSSAGSTIARGVARWNGESWSPVGHGLRDGIVYAFTIFDDGRGDGPALYAGGSFESSGGVAVRRLAKWDGASWSEVGGGIEGGPSTKPAVHALQVFDDGTGPALYVGGLFTSVGGETVNYIARWDGQAWSPVGIGMYYAVHALAVLDDGAGPALYAGGRFQVAGGVPAKRVAKWDGASWSEVGGGMDGGVESFAVFNDGRGDALYAGGSFSMAGGSPASRIARWDGHSWSDVGGGTDRPASLTVFDDGRGPALYAGGAFTMAGDIAASGIARWDGAEWSSLGVGVWGSPVPTVVSMTAFDDGTGPALYVGGRFYMAGGVSANNIARWRCERAGCYADCDGDGELTFFDFLCFQNLFTAGDPLADCDESGQLDFFDFLCFQNAFAAGCE